MLYYTNIQYVTKYISAKQKNLIMKMRKNLNADIIKMYALNF